MSASLIDPAGVVVPTWTAVHQLAATQSGVITRRQALDCGASEAMLRHQVEAARWQRLERGVFATFTGSPDWLAHAWAAVLSCGEGAVLSHCCALAVWGMRLNHHDQKTVHVSVDHQRRVQPGEGIVLHRVKGLPRFVHPVRRPPVMRFEHALLQQASSGSAANAIGLVADSCQQRLTTPSRLNLALSSMPKLRLRGMLRDLLHDVASGAYSYLEVRYLRDVERAHGLPTGARQRRVRLGPAPYFRDLEYLLYSLVLELDGRLGHEDFDGRWADLERDLDTRVAGSTSVRIGYGQAVGDPCRTAAGVWRLLHSNGLTQPPHACGPSCTIANWLC